MALETLFHGKCAYCETKLTEGWNVDHHRPKKRVKERPDHPGYYWLAYEWTNLYPACNGCNQHLRDRPHWDANQQNDRAAGKADQFPLDDERHRAMSPTDDIARELPYVLDPCDDEPQLYLTFDIQGNVLAIDDDVFGETTIDVCHLDRYRLSLARAKVIETVVEMLGARELAARAGWAEAIRRAAAHGSSSSPSGPTARPYSCAAPRCSCTRVWRLRAGGSSLPGSRSNATLACRPVRRCMSAAIGEPGTGSCG